MYERGGDGGRLVPKRSEYCKIRFFWGGEEGERFGWRMREGVSETRSTFIVREKRGGYRQKKPYEKKRKRLLIYSRAYIDRHAAIHQSWYVNVNSSVSSNLAAWPLAPFDAPSFTSIPRHPHSQPLLLRLPILLQRILRRRNLQPHPRI